MTVNISRKDELRRVNFSCLKTYLIPEPCARGDSYTIVGAEGMWKTTYGIFKWIWIPPPTYAFFHTNQEKIVWTIRRIQPLSTQQGSCNDIFFLIFNPHPSPAWKYVRVQFVFCFPGRFDRRFWIKVNTFFSVFHSGILNRWPNIFRPHPCLWKASFLKAPPLLCGRHCCRGPTMLLIII